MLKRYGLLLTLCMLLLACNVPTAREQAVATLTPPPLHGRIAVTSVQAEDETARFAGTSTLPEGTCLQTQLFAEGVPESWWPIDTCVPVTEGTWAIEVALDMPLDHARDYTFRAWAFDNPAIQSESYWVQVVAPPAPTSTPPPPTGLLPAPPITPPPPDWTPTRLPPYDPEHDDPEAQTRAYLRLVTDMLNAAYDIDSVLAELAAWMTQDSTYEGDLPPNAWAEAHDLDGDGTDEWIISVPVQDSWCGVPYCPGYVFLAERHAGLFIPRHQITSTIYEMSVGHPRLLKVSDITADGHLEIVLEETHCGAHTCFTTLIVGRWDGTRWHDLAADPISQAYTDYTMQDETGDGKEEITMYGGMIGSVGAGLQRPHTLTFAWRDGAYRLISDEPAPSDHPYFQMLDAHTALVAGEWDRALELARAVLDRDALDPDESLWMTDRHWTRILGYSAIEAMLVHAHRGDAPAMESVLVELRARDVITEANPYLEGAAQLLVTYTATGDALAACQAMAATLLDYDTDARAFLEWYGYNTEYLPDEQLCPWATSIE